MSRGGRARGSLSTGERPSGVSVAILDRKLRRVLIQLRPFPPGWELPGGHLGQSESVEDCAVREVLEECGLVVELKGFVGSYRWSGLRHVTDLVYWGHIAGGTRRRTLESLSSRFVEPTYLPKTLFPWYRERIEDAFACARDNATPVQRTQEVSWQQVGFFGSQWLEATRAVVSSGVAAGRWKNRHPERDHSITGAKNVEEEKTR